VTASVDAANAIAETAEGNNALSINFSPVAPTGLPANKFLWPVGGVNGRDYSVVNYNDVDPRSGVRSDYRGGPFQYDGHDAFDITLPNFARMDSGIPIVAAADGTVAGLIDDQFDRDVGAPLGGHPGNYLAIDHGNNWSTVYYHIAKFTALVRNGDTVKAGQPIALVGSSGNSSDAHLHFSVNYRGMSVEPMFAPSTYFADPPSYQGDMPPTVTDAGILNEPPPNGSWKERPDDIVVFPTSAGDEVWFWYRLTNWNAGETYLIKWYRPNGALAATYDWDATSSGAYGGFNWVINASTVASFPGDWHVALELNGTELVRKAFTVTTGAGTPEVRLTQGSTFIISGRTTPIDFGSVAAGGSGPTLTFTIANPATATLSVSNLRLPPGYSLVGSFPTSVAAGADETFDIRLDAAGPGTKFGAIRFDTNDTDEDTFWFNVSGIVTGTRPTGTPVLIDMPGLAPSRSHPRSS